MVVLMKTWHCEVRNPSSSSSSMAASQLCSVCLTHRSIRACRALLPCPLPLPLVFPKIPPLAVARLHSKSSSNNRPSSGLLPILFPRGSRSFCAFDAFSGSDLPSDKKLNVKRFVVPEEIQLEEEISRLERQTEIAAKVGSSPVLEHEEWSPDLTEQKKTAGSARVRRSSEDKESEEISERKGRPRADSEQNAGSRSKSSSKQTEPMASIAEDFSSDAEFEYEDDDEDMELELEEDFSSDEGIDDDTGNTVEAQEPKSEGSTAGIQTTHPWQEWNAFLDVLYRKEYFADLPQDALMDGGGSQVSSYMKHAVANFSRDRDDIIRFLTKKDIRMIANIDCPSTDRKVVNASKRLRVLTEIPEEQVCQQCKMKTVCTRAFAEPAAHMDAGTIDVARVLYSFAMNASPNVESQVAYPIGVVKSACHLLKEIVQLSAYPKDPGLPKASLPSSTNRLPVVKKTSESQNPDQRPGDWTCPDCNFLNFSKNRECRECGTFKEHAQKQLEPGDWECPECTYVNFRRNKECRECFTPRPHNTELADGQNTMPGDWKCSECEFMNFRRNSECRRCSATRPRNTEGGGGEELEPGDWRCPECNFRNFGRNRTCRECNTKRPADTYGTGGDRGHGIKMTSTRSDGGGWGSHKSVSSSRDSGWSRLKHKEWKPELKGPMSDDIDDDDLEEDADIVISQEAQDSVPDEDSDSDFNFSDVDDERPKKTSVKNVQGEKRRLTSKRFEEHEDDDEDDDMSEAEDELSEGDHVPFQSASKHQLSKGRNSRRWDDDLSEDEDKNIRSYGGQIWERGRGRGRGRVGFDSRTEGRVGHRRGQDHSNGKASRSWDDDLSEDEDELTEDSGQNLGRGRGRGRGRGGYDNRSGERVGQWRGQVISDDMASHRWDDDLSEDEGQSSEDEGRNWGRGRGRGRGGYASSYGGRGSQYGSGMSEGRGGYRNHAFSSDDEMGNDRGRDSRFSGGRGGRGANRSVGRDGFRNSSFSSNHDSSNGRGRGGFRGSSSGSRGRGSFRGSSSGSRGRGGFRGSSSGSGRGRGGRRFESRGSQR